ncbi:MAG: VIT1/CCC1 transporter family protein [Acidobacteria bacterium]|nr:VIT1/CCC1 transporter family protein [Acidobacteriota bacterium]
MADGLVTNVALMLGFAGAAADPSSVRLAGLAGLVAGGFSMASGEYLSMQAQKELFEREIEVERKSLRENPAEEKAELVALFEERGVDPKLAGLLADELMRDPDLALRTHAREELGVDPSAIGSPWRAAVGSLVSFALGAFIPLVPWLVNQEGKPIDVSIALGVIAAASLGGAIGKMTGRGAIRSASRFLAISTASAAVTYIVGAAIG